VPKIDKRIERALKRLDAGAGTRGSVNRLQQRVDNAKKAGHTDIATYLQDRLNHRKSLRTDLEQRQKDLTAVKSWCEDNNAGKEAS
jgi:outer membrane protein TolC